MTLARPAGWGEKQMLYSLRTSGGEEVNVVPERAAPIIDTPARDKKLLLEAWNADPFKLGGDADNPPSSSEIPASSEIPGRGFLDPSLLVPGSSPFGEAGSGSIESWAHRLLRSSLALLGGERAFLFELVPQLGGSPPELAGCYASADLDGDPISAPLEKVSASVLFDVVNSKTPWHRRLRDGLEAESALVAIPALTGETCRAILVVENRFRDLNLSADTLAPLRGYTAQLAIHLEVDRLVSENEGLLADLHRLRDAAPTPATGALPTTALAPASVPAKQRKGLSGDYSMIVGSSPIVMEILGIIDRISTSSAPVLINGESGTGKELIALAVHKNSPRKGKAFVSENCAAITETLLESELFGYVRGAFTGANKDHKGLFELADGGTLFLDEVGDMSSSMQKKLLRVLQEGVIRAVGAKEYTPVDVRIVSATNKDLLTECRNGRFREDLYYRLNVINLKLPPLRDRREDVADIARFFLAQSKEDMGRSFTIESAALESLARYSWPGNVRELQNEIKKICALSEDEVIRVRDLSPHLLEIESDQSNRGNWPFDLGELTLREATEQLERDLIQRALDELSGNKSQVAKLLQIPKTSLYNKINKYGLT